MLSFVQTSLGKLRLLFRPEALVSGASQPRLNCLWFPDEPGCVDPSGHFCRTQIFQYLADKTL